MFNARWRIVFNNIIKELYRICKHNSIIEIKVPHPRHDDFISDPTHVRPITTLGLELYNKDLNLEWESKGAANTPLALIHSVNFKIEKVDYKLEENYSNLLKNGKNRVNFTHPDLYREFRQCRAGAK